MFRKSANWRYVVLLSCLLLSPICLYGQDLGSSNDLFRKNEPAKKRTTPKKKRKSSRAKKTSPRKRTTTRRKRSSSRNKKPVTAKKTETSKAINEDVIIEIGKSNKSNEVKAEKEKSSVAKTEKNDTDKKQLQSKNDLDPRNKTVIKISEIKAEKSADVFEKEIIEGNKERNVRNYDKAENAYIRAQKLKTGDFRAVYGLGNLYSDQGRWEEAERAYKTAIRMSPDEPAPYIALSFVLTQPLTGKNLLERYDEAEKMTRRAIALDSDNAFAYDQLGVALELQGEISDETLKAYKKAVELDPTSALAYAHLGRLLRKKGEIKDSSKAYLSAIQFSVDVPTMIMVADVMQSQQRYLESEQLLRRALREDPKHPTALFLLGRALTTRGSYAEAENILKKSAEVSPNSFVSYKLLGSLYARQEKFNEAEMFLQKALKVISPEEKKRLSFEFEAVGDGYMKKNKNSDAARVYGQAVMLDKKRAELSEKLAKAQEN